MTPRRSCGNARSPATGVDRQRGLGGSVDQRLRESPASVDGDVAGLNEGMGEAPPQEGTNEVFGRGRRRPMLSSVRAPPLDGARHRAARPGRVHGSVDIRRPAAVLVTGQARQLEVPEALPADGVGAVHATPPEQRGPHQRLLHDVSQGLLQRDLGDVGELFAEVVVHALVGIGRRQRADVSTGAGKRALELGGRHRCQLVRHQPLRGVRARHRCASCQHEIQGGAALEVVRASGRELGHRSQRDREALVACSLSGLARHQQLEQAVDREDVGPSAERPIPECPKSSGSHVRTNERDHGVERRAGRSSSRGRQR